MDEATLRGGVERLVTAVGGRRRLLSAVLVAIAVVAGLRALTPPAPRTTAIWAAARDLSGGRPLTAHDLRRIAVPTALVPAGALRAGAEVTGRLLAAPVRAGEPLTDVRLLEPALLDALADPDLVAVPVHVADGSAAAALVHAGDVVDVLAVTEPGSGAATPAVIAAGVKVLTVPAAHGAEGDGGGLVVVAVSSHQAAALARASASSRLSLALERP